MDATVQPSTSAHSFSTSYYLPTLGDAPSCVIVQLIVFPSKRQHRHRHEARFRGTTLVGLSTAFHFPAPPSPSVPFIHYRTTFLNALAIFITMPSHLSPFSHVLCKPDRWPTHLVRPTSVFITIHDLRIVHRRILPCSTPLLFSLIYCIVSQQEK